MKQMWQDPVFILMFSSVFGWVFNAMYIHMKTWLLTLRVHVWLWKEHTEYAAVSHRIETEMIERLSIRSVLLFPSLLQFSPGHCARWWRSTASSLATQSTGMWTCPPPLTASFGSGPSTPTWTLYITTTATEPASIITEIPSRATLRWITHHEKDRKWCHGLALIVSDVWPRHRRSFRPLTGSYCQIDMQSSQPLFVVLVCGIRCRFIWIDYTEITDLNCKNIKCCGKNIDFIDFTANFFSFTANNAPYITFMHLTLIQSDLQCIQTI